MTEDQTASPPDLPPSQSVVMADFERDVQKLFGEVEVLRKLIYRNEKQHVFTKHRALYVREKAVEVLRLVHVGKRVDDRSVCSQILVMKGLKLCLGAMSSAVQRTEGALMCLVAQLKIRVFAPLFSLLVALCSRIHACLTVMYLPLQDVYKTIHEQLMNVLNVVIAKSPESPMAQTISTALKSLVTPDSFQRPQRWVVEQSQERDIDHTRTHEDDLGEILE